MEVLCRTTNTNKKQAIYESYDYVLLRTHRQAIDRRTGAKKRSSVYDISSSPKKQKEIEPMGDIVAIRFLEDVDLIASSFANADMVYSYRLVSPPT